MKRKADPKEIARLESEVGLDDASLYEAARQTRQSPEWKENGGAIELNKPWKMGIGWDGVVWSTAPAFPVIL